MSEAKKKHDWDQTAGLWSELLNSQRDPKTKRFLPSVVHPYRTDKEYKPKPIESDITVLKALLKNGNGHPGR